MSSWLDEASVKNSKKATQANHSNALEDLTSIVYAFFNTVTKFENMAKYLGTPKETAEMRKKMVKLREGTKSQAKDLSERLRRIDFDRDFFKDPKEWEQFRKLKKQFEEQLKRFDVICNETAQKEKAKQTSKKGYSKMGDDDEDEDGENQGTDGGLQKNEPKFVLLEADANTTQTEKEIAKQIRDDLLSMETDMNELNQMFHDIKDLIDEQQESIDTAQQNIRDANANVEAAVVDIVEARKMSFCNIT